MIEEIRISSLGVIDESVLELGDGLTVITGETGAGKTMLVTALGLLLGGRADTGAVRTGARAARVEGVVRAGAELAAIADEHGGEVEGGLLLLGRQVSAEGRSRAFLGGASVPASALARVGDVLVAVHGQSDQHRLLRPEAQRDALDAYAGAGLAEVLGRYRAGFARLRAVEAELREVLGSARERAREADVLRLGLEEIEAVDPQPGEEESLATEESRLGFADTLRTPPRPRARRCPPTGRPRRPRRGGRGSTGAGERARARPGGGGAGRPGRRGELPARRRGGRRGVVLHGRGDRPRPAGRGVRAAGGADRADPEVRRERRRGPRVVAGLRRATAQPGRLRRADRGAARRAGAAARARWPTRPPS